MIYIPSFIKTGLAIQKLIAGYTDTQQGDLISPLSLFKKMKVGLCDLLPVCVSIASKGSDLLDERRNRPFSVGTLTEQSSGPPAPPPPSDGD
jgi:hypothetical protein